MVDDLSLSQMPCFVLYSFELCEHYHVCEVKNVLRKIQISDESWKSKFTDYIYVPRGWTSWVLVSHYLDMCLMCYLGFLRVEGHLLISLTTVETDWISWHSFFFLMKSVATQKHIQQCVIKNCFSHEIFTEYHCLYMFIVGQ